MYYFHHLWRNDSVAMEKKQFSRMFQFSLFCVWNSERYCSWVKLQSKNRFAKPIENHWCVIEFIRNSE